VRWSSHTLFFLCIVSFGYPLELAVFLALRALRRQLPRLDARRSARRSPRSSPSQMCWSADAIQLEQFCILSHALVKRVRVNSRNSLAREMYALLYKFAKKMFFVAPSETQVRWGGGGVPTWRNTGVQSVPTPKNSNALRASMYQHTHNTTDANFVFFWRSSSCGAAGVLDRCSLPHVLPEGTHSSHSSSSSVSVNKKIRFAKQRCPACPPPAKQACPREKSVPRKTFSSRTCMWLLYMEPAHRLLGISPHWAHDVTSLPLSDRARRLETRRE